MFNQNIKKKQKLILAAIFIFVFAAGFGFSTHVHAKSCECASKEDWERGNFIYLTPVDQPTKEACAQYCNSNNQTANFKFDNGSDEIKKTTGEIVQQQMGDTVCGMGMGDIISLSVLINFVKCLLLYVLLFLEKMLEVSSTLFIWILDAKNFTDVMSNPIIYQIWGMVRDTLNISFILVLLFSAFCTVFQVEKFNYKKILLTLIIMALLVNFSFPIARVIIDFSNIIMYYFAKALGFDKSAGSWFAEIAKNSNLDLILHPPQKIGADLSFLIAAVIFSFILAVTLLIIAILFIIRLVALTILVIFSSIAFVGSIVPFLSSYASKWWDMLFKYAFFGPIMLFMLVVATRMMGAISYTKGSMNAITGQSASDPGFIAAASFFAIPIVILWIGIGTAQTMSIAGASAVVGRGQKFMGWAGKTLTPAGFAIGAWESYRTRRKEAQKDSWGNRLGSLVGSKQDRLRSIVPGRGGRDAQLRYERDLTQKVEAEAKRRDTANATTGDLQNLATTGNRFERAAAVQELANREQATADQLNNVRESFGETSQVFNQLVAKVRAYDPAASFAHIEDEATRETAITEHLRSNKFDSKKLNTNSLGNIEFMRLAARNGAISTKDLEELRGKSIFHERNIRDSLTTLGGEQEFNRIAQYDNTVADSRDQIADIQHELNTNTGLSDPERRELQQQLTEAQEIMSRNEVQLRNARNIQISYYAQTGNFHETINDDNNPSQVIAKNQVVQRLDKETAKRTSAQTIRNDYQTFADNIRANKYKDIVLGMDNIESQREMNTRMQNARHATGSANAQSLHRLAIRDNMLRHIHN